METMRESITTDTDVNGNINHVRDWRFGRPRSLMEDQEVSGPAQPKARARRMLAAARNGGRLPRIGCALVGRIR